MVGSLVWRVLAPGGRNPNSKDARWNIKWTLWIFTQSPSKELEFYWSLCVLFNCDCNADGDVCESIWKLHGVIYGTHCDWVRRQVNICLEMKISVRLKRLLYCLGFFLGLFSARCSVEASFPALLSLFLPPVLTVTPSCPLRRHTHLLLHAV